MQKVKLLSFNIQGKKSKREKESIIKVAVLIKYMKENKFDIACIQETKTKQGELYETIVSLGNHEARVSKIQTWRSPRRQKSNSQERWSLALMAPA